MNAPPKVEPRYEGGSGEPLVLLHGIQASWAVWKPVLPALSEKHAVFAPTIAGHRGAVSLPEGVKASPATLADAVEKGLDEAGIDTAHFAGNSLGGWLSLELAKRGRARSVVALSPAGAFATDKDMQKVIKMLAQGRKMSVALAPKLGPLIRRPRGRKLLLKLAQEHGDRVPAAEMAAFFDDLIACEIFDDFVDSIRADGGFTAGLNADAFPIRIAWGAKDRVIPFAAHGQPLLDLIPGAEQVMMPGVGHVPMYDDPELVARTILEVTTKTTTTSPPASANGSGPAVIPTEKETPVSTTSAATDYEYAGAEGKIVARIWPNDSARYAVLLAHGYGEHTGRYEHVAAHLVAHGATVYAPDHLGHGRSDGEMALVKNMDTVAEDLHLLADKLRADHPDLPVVLIGHSMGGIIATRFVQKYPGEVKALVLSGPAIGGNPGFAQLLEMDPIPEIPIDPAVLSRDPAVGEAYAADDLVYHGPFQRPTLEALFGAVGTIAEAGDFGDLPTFWIHGTEDGLAPYDVTKEAVERVGGSALSAKAYEGAAHEVFNETNKDEVLSDVTTFIDGVL